MSESETFPFRCFICLHSFFIIFTFFLFFLVYVCFMFLFFLFLFCLSSFFSIFMYLFIYVFLFALATLPCPALSGQTTARLWLILAAACCHYIKARHSGPRTTSRRTTTRDRLSAVRKSRPLSDRLGYVEVLGGGGRERPAASSGSPPPPSPKTSVSSGRQHSPYQAWSDFHARRPDIH
jgi:hypothetical protein